MFTATQPTSAETPMNSSNDGTSHEVSITKLDNLIGNLEEQNMTGDSRYNSALQLKAKLTGGQPPEIPTKTASPIQKASELTPSQLNQLKAQINVYRLLARNEPVPSELALLANPVKAKNLGHLPDPYEYPMEGENGEKLPYDLMKVLYLHQQKANRQTTLPTPKGIDPISLLKEREYRIQNRIGLRIVELGNLPADLPEMIRVKCEIELRSLRLVNLQAQMRSEIMGVLKRDTTLETALNPYAYRRTKRQTLREARVTEKLEKQQKMEAERKRDRKSVV